MKLLHTMIRVKDLGATLDFYVGFIGLKEVRRKEIGDEAVLVFLTDEREIPDMQAITYDYGDFTMTCEATTFPPYMRKSGGDVRFIRLCIQRKCAQCRQVFFRRLDAGRYCFINPVEFRGCDIAEIGDKQNIPLAQSTDFRLSVSACQEAGQLPGYGQD